jgi:Protein of unknown function (DUF3105)
VIVASSRFPAPESLDLPLPALAMLAALLATGTFALVIGVGGGHRAARAPYAPLGDVVRKAGCSLSEFDHKPHNPPVSGRFIEQDRAADGSYVGRKPPSLPATIHAMYHGRVLVQYRPDLPAAQVKQLERFVESDSNMVLLFANQTAMHAPVAATSYLSVMTCPRVDAQSLRALRVYRDRRRGFGQAF